MNPAERIWDIPPPPGTEDELQLTLVKESTSSTNEVGSPAKDSPKQEESKPPDDCVSPAIKVEPPENIIEKKSSSERNRYRSRSRSRDKYHRRRYSRSRSRDRHRRSRSRSRRRRRRYSSSRSRSRSPSYRRQGRHKYSRYRRSPSSRYSRSRSRSYSRSRHKSHKSRRTRDRSRSKTHSPHGSEDHNALPDADTSTIDMKIEEEEDEEVPKDNVFKNDGSFLEMFKKMQEQQKSQEETKAEESKKSLLPAFGKRRGGKVLKTGLVEKVRHQNEEENVTDAWSVYMKEVRKYKEACCDDDSKTRPLVK